MIVMLVGMMWLACKHLGLSVLGRSDRWTAAAHGPIKQNVIDTVGHLCLMQSETLWVATRAHYFHPANLTELKMSQRDAAKEWLIRF